MKLFSILIIFSSMFQDSTSFIFNSNNVKNTSNWYIINDGVMGGLSKGSLSINEKGNVLFRGFVTTENNGGFSSTRYAFGKKDVTTHNHIVLRIKGDGKSYQFRIKEKSSQRYSYVTSFKTSGTWETIKIPFSEFYPSFRGYRLDKPNYFGAEMEEVAFLIGNKKKESFELAIESIFLK